jgi:hypothetical protein
MKNYEVEILKSNIEMCEILLRVQHDLNILAFFNNNEITNLLNIAIAGNQALIDKAIKRQNNFLERNILN